MRVFVIFPFSKGLCTVMMKKNGDACIPNNCLLVIVQGTYRIICFLLSCHFFGWAKPTTSAN